jgi:hypothetical protein
MRITRLALTNQITAGKACKLDDNAVYKNLENHAQAIYAVNNEKHVSLTHKTC